MEGTSVRTNSGGKYRTPSRTRSFPNRTCAILLTYGLFQKGRVLAQDGVADKRNLLGLSRKKLESCATPEADKWWGCLRALNGAASLDALTLQVHKTPVASSGRTARSSQAMASPNHAINAGSTFCGAQVTQLLQSILRGVSRFDSLSFRAVAYVACWVPATRVTRTDPVTTTLRE